MPPFQFKHFSIQQDSSAMKVGTDGVLLGAWSTVKEGNILDIGAGTGLISIMLAQRNSTSHIDAVELQKDAYQEAKTNIENCKWSERFSIFNCPIQAYQTDKKYDLIVSNPPFFTNATKAPQSDRNAARHTDSLPFTDLINTVLRLLKPDGLFSLILPTVEAEHFILLAKEKSLFINRKWYVKPTATKSSKRVLMEFSFHNENSIVNELIIETETRHQYTPEYITLTKDFYLKF
jgi:tRNA1Val (adenine37-N6)-methyltransferase